MMTSNQAEHILRAIYAKHNPDKKKDIEDLLIKYRNNENELVESVFKKYQIGQQERLQYLNFEINNRPNYSTNNRSNVVAVVIILIAIISIILLVVKKHDEESDTTLITKIDEDAPPLMINADSLKAENEWSVFQANFIDAIRKKDKKKIIALTSKNFSDGGGGETIEEWLTNIALTDQHTIDFLSRIVAQKLETSVLKDGTIEKVTGKNEQGDLYFDYVNQEWKFGGLIGD